ncbi:ABC transporter permease [Geomonas sp. RF6]|uniref:ABC transporter permease n=1 Tax=Geomonas sp. RF6 TaxID=2897342 RepID=UPI001E3B831B|nr:ABC transporter permease [Geomonas sp. RF6]UFS70070.1 ABC transporter permease [Geomonas sp. RF6]
MTTFLQSLLIAIRALRVNKMRSLLTMLGIIIGIAAVIAMVAIGSGASKMISDQISSIGSNLLLVLPGSMTSGGVRTGSGGTQTLTYDDAKAIKSECPSVAEVAPTLRGGGQVVYGNQNWSTVLMGVTPAMLTVRDWPISAGRNITQSDVDGATKVCLLGQTVADNLFGSADPLGKIIRIRKIPFTVVGVLDRKGQSPQGQDQDDIIYLPLTTAQRKLLGTQFPASVGALMVQAKSAEVLKQAEEEVTALLNQRHRIGPSREIDFTVRNLSELLAVSEQASKVLAMLLGSVASISLLVGGIGIMNIMLVSVTERTREIGIRIAIGAKRRDILLQFLTEAVLLTTMGGIIGILCGIAGAAVVAKVIGWPTLISPATVIISFGFSAAVGVFFGFYPARKAASLNPIDALRYE